MKILSMPPFGFAVLLMMLLGTSLFGQQKNSEPDHFIKADTVSLKEKGLIKFDSKSSEQKYTPASFYIINDKPATRAEYMNYLLRLEEEKKKQLTK